jgi:hypothetical protein
MGKLKLTVNEEKTRICTVPSGEFDFLGYSFGQMYSENRPGTPGVTGHRRKASSAWCRPSTH